MHPIGVRRAAFNQIPHVGALNVQGGPNRRNRLVPIRGNRAELVRCALSCPLFVDSIVSLLGVLQFGPWSPPIEA
jgi:hypothetical protein